MWLEVRTFVTPASLWRRRSSKPNRGAGLTMVVSGKMLRTTCSPRPYIWWSAEERSGWTGLVTFVLKNSDGDLASALYEETWMKRSTSYFATASAIRSAPSTWTSSRSKFLPLVKFIAQNCCKWSDVLGGIHSTNEIIDNVWMSNAFLQRLCVSQIIFLVQFQQCSFSSMSYHTMNITRPKSPATFKWRFAISSRKGTITVHPCRAVIHPLVLHIWGPRMRSNRTKSVHNVSSKKSSSTEDCNSMS